MQDAEKPTYLRVYHTPYDQLKAMGLEELEKLCREVSEDARKAALTQRWLEGIPRRRNELAGSQA